MYTIYLSILIPSNKEALWERAHNIISAACIIIKHPMLDKKKEEERVNNKITNLSWVQDKPLLLWKQPAHGPSTPFPRRPKQKPSSRFFQSLGPCGSTKLSQTLKNANSKSKFTMTENNLYSYTTKGCQLFTFSRKRNIGHPKLLLKSYILASVHGYTKHKLGVFNLWGVFSVPNSRI